MALSHSIWRYIVTCVSALAVAQVFPLPVAHAEPVLLSVEGQGALPITDPQASWFGPGAALAVAAHYPLSPVWLIGVRLRAGLLSDGDAPSVAGVRDPGLGTFELIAAMLRVRPLGRATDERLGPGLFFDLGAGGGVTGSDARPSVEAGVGYGFGVGKLCLAPTLRYLQVIQPQQALSGEDARLLLAGVELTFNDQRPQPKPLEQVVVEPPDRDQDGIPDATDRCPDEPEDLDGFEDEDGCPDPDNDKDGVADAQDRCPTDPEDRDGFEDMDGCPDPDNDGDGVLDLDDQCPDKAEVINGVADYDGCPDEGQIVFENDRIVLEERVLFDFQLARVRMRARPVLDAIVKLRAQHAEWGAIQIEGHADARGNQRFNQELSERRARNVMRVLTDLGIPAEVMSSVGYGAARLRDHGTSEDAHQRNRRVEFVVVTRISKPVTTPAESAPATPAPTSAPPAEAKPAEPQPDAVKPEAKPGAAVSPGESLEGSRLAPHAGDHAAHEEAH